MTILTSDKKLQIQTLFEAKLGYRRIATQLELNCYTMKSFKQKWNMLRDLPPPIRLSKDRINARYGLIIKKYLSDYPLATLSLGKYIFWIFGTKLMMKLEGKL